MFKRVVNVVEVLALVGAVAAIALLFVAEPDERVAAGTSAGASSAGGGADYLPETGALPTNGREVYAARCAGCHGRDGQGGSGPALADRVADRFPDPEDQIVVVSRGRGAMPAFGSSLSDAEIRAVVTYTRTELGD
ncbi:MAG: hypothetical protein AMXMBFR46_24240 [Acidimicrobiia bacterium]